MTRTTSSFCWLDQTTASEHLGISEKTLRRYVAEGRIPAYRMGARLLRFRSDDLDALMEPVPTAGTMA